MKVILQKDVKGMGRVHEVAEVSNGYALNYLFPKRLAIAATPSALQSAELRRKQKKDTVALEAGLLAQNIASLAEVNLVIRTKVNEKGHLYDAVGEHEIRKAAKEQAHVDLPEGAIKPEAPIKEVGTFTIPVAVGETFGSFSVTIEAE
jgi:large subunit ribosomal protein L9